MLEVSVPQSLQEVGFAVRECSHMPKGRLRLTSARRIVADGPLSPSRQYAGVKYLFGAAIGCFIFSFIQTRDRWTRRALMHTQGCAGESEFYARPIKL